MTRSRTGAIVAALATLVAVAAITAASAPAAANDPIVIGWAFDGNGAMAPFDGPALAKLSTQHGVGVAFAEQRIPMLDIDLFESLTAG